MKRSSPALASPLRTLSSYATYPQKSHSHADSRERSEQRLPGANDAPAIESGNNPQARPRNSHIGNRRVRPTPKPPRRQPARHEQRRATTSPEDRKLVED